MEFTKHSRLIAIGLQQLGKGDIGSIKRKVVVDFPVEVAVLSSEDNRTRRRTNRIGDTGIGKEHAFFGNAVDIGGL